MKKKQLMQKLLTLSDIKTNGERKGDIIVNNPKLFSRILAKGSLGLGEAYMEGWWDCEDLDIFFDKLLSAKVNKKIKPINAIFPLIKAKFVNLQNKKRSKKVAEQHYDLGNEFYSDMLDKRMQYTCGYFKNTTDLEKAQENKLELVCRKLKLKKGEKVLELGGGWGGFAKYASENYGVHVTSYNISKEQVAYARKICKGLPVEIKQEDYRKAKGKYDKVASIGLCEHVGPKNIKKFISLVNDCLKENGLFLLHTIGKNSENKYTDPWIEKYIFPNGSIPTIPTMANAFDKKLVLEDWHNFGSDYDKTLMVWYDNFNKNWEKHKEQYGKTFHRMWRYYLLMCAGSFRTRNNGQLWQIVLSKNGIRNGYESER